MPIAACLFRRPAWMVMLGAILLWGASPNAAWAGGGPENVCLVVNARSWASLALANHFAKMRQIPDSNVVYLDWGGSTDQTDIETFRRKILQPVILVLAQRKVIEQIDYIVYSSDFPWSIDARREFKGLTLPPPLEPVCSITAMTFFAQPVLDRKSDYLNGTANYYARLFDAQSPEIETQGFRSWYGWGPRGTLLEAGGRSYFLSAMLGVTSGRGNSVAEAVTYLTHSAEADATHPTGTIYYMENNDIRTTPRQAQFEPAIEALDKLGVKAEVLHGVLPRHKDDVQGLMTGTAGFNWPTSGSTIRPGAFCDNLTSFGGDLRDGAGQTPLTEFLRYGAAGSSGTVVEPFNLHLKFPLAQVHVHYARGCSLAEAFYQSVNGPFQLLFVGDPLCRPWADIPRITVAGLAAGTTVSGSIAMTPQAEIPGDSKAAVDRFLWFLDGTQVAVTNPGDQLTLNTVRLVDGYHELRVVGIDNTPIETQGRAILPFTVDNQHASIEFTRVGSGTVRWGEPLTVQVKSPGAVGSVVMQGVRTLGRITGEEGTVTLDPRIFGLGPVSLHATTLVAEGSEKRVVSAPLKLNIEPNKPLPGIKLQPDTALQPGFEVQPVAGKAVVVNDATKADWLSRCGIESGQTFSVTGTFHVEHPAVYQCQIRCAGPMSLEVDGQPLFITTEANGALQYVPVSLATGYHQLQLRGTADKNCRLHLAFGTRGVQTVNGEWLGHVMPIPAAPK